MSDATFRGEALAGAALMLAGMTGTLGGHVGFAMVKTSR
jgi:hypothetical protein